MTSQRGNQQGRLATFVSFSSDELTMRRGHSSRADAILNSPVVRAFLRPITTLVTPLPYSPPTALELISTQPPPSLPSPAPVAGPSKLPLTSALVSAPIQNYKRGRDEEDEGRKEVERDAKDVVVSYTEDNLPPELTKCMSHLPPCRARRILIREEMRQTGTSDIVSSRGSTRAVRWTSKGGTL